MSSPDANPPYDALVIGAGPAGSTAALVLAREGFRVLVADRATFPHFHIGESLLPRNLALLRELGIDGALAALPQVPKHGAEFAMGHGRDAGSIWFKDGLVPGEDRAFNIARAPFDAELLRLAREAGAEVVEGVAVRELPRLEDGDVAAVLDDGREFRARWLVDASGQATVVGRLLGTRRVLPDLKKVAYFGHFTGVERKPGLEGGFISIVMCDEGWFWIIPLDERKTSIGLVMGADAARAAGVPASRMLAWGIARCPLLAARTASATTLPTNGVLADFSYRCEPFAGPGYFLAGDAATFVDPIFSTGVCLGMMSGVRAARGIAAILGRGAEPARVRRDYVRFVDGSSSTFFRLVRAYYGHPFRELFLEARGPLQVHRAVISALAGEVFPRPAFAMRWRLALFDLFVRLQRHVAIAPRKEGWSLLGADAGPAGAPETEPLASAG